MIRKNLGDWSLSLEDPFYAEHPKQMLKDALQGIDETAEGQFVNIVTPGEAGDPREQFMELVTKEWSLRSDLPIRLEYRGECGCGGHVLRVYKQAAST